MTGLKERIAGEITISDEPGEIIRKWREMFEVSQIRLAEEMDIASSVISDYEKGRRKPGALLVKKIVESLIKIDEERGGVVIDRFTRPGQEGILSKNEFPEPVSLKELLQDIEGKILSETSQEKNIYGYTVIDSMKAILSMKSFDYLSIYGWSTERILFFEGVEHGRSPLVAIRSTPLSPAAVCYIQPKNVDDLSRKLAEVEGIPLIRTDLDTDELIKKMKKWL
ncbi:MAG: helix-turn-helix domain-containing protein [Candidatus Thermoplasmatota archaeon]|nr:helix-turn-helix domain-containing protein [Candidatus Thermoplasmatota archaeon]MBS3790376.1 helix-turn-helix domain-containing protein [Candidatus Thermoplasmatota archaeon]